MLIRSLPTSCPAQNRDEHSLFTGRRLAAQKGESDDLVGAMKAEEEAQKAEQLLDDDDDEFKDE
jgi:hypothetical protein